MTRSDLFGKQEVIFRFYLNFVGVFLDDSLVCLDSISDELLNVTF